jgi:hypothetical protein
VLSHGTDAEATLSAREWLLRATQITSPSVEILFREDLPPHQEDAVARDAPHPAPARDGPADCQFPEAGVDAQDARWQEVDACLFRQARRDILSQMVEANINVGPGQRGLTDVAAKLLRAGARLYSAGRVADGLRCVRVAVRLQLQGAAMSAENTDEDGDERVFSSLMTLGEMLSQQGRDGEGVAYLAQAMRRLRVTGRWAGSTSASAVMRSAEGRGKVAAVLGRWIHVHIYGRGIALGRGAARASWASLACCGAGHPLLVAAPGIPCLLRRWASLACCGAGHPLLVACHSFLGTWAG